MKSRRLLLNKLLISTIVCESYQEGNLTAISVPSCPLYPELKNPPKKLANL